MPISVPAARELADAQTLYARSRQPWRAGQPKVLEPLLAIKAEEKTDQPF